MRRMGCLVILAVLALVAWMYRGTLIRMVRGDRGTVAERTNDTPSGASTWQTMTPEGARRAQTTLERLRSARGPAYENVTPADLAAYIVQELSKTLPGSAENVEAAAIGDRLYVRATVRTSDLGGSSLLGPLAGMLREREPILLGGTLRIIRPGFGEMRVKELKIGEFPVPSPLIPRLIKQLSRGPRPPELADDGLALQTPPYIGDVRVSDGRITMYKTQPPTTK